MGRSKYINTFNTTAEYDAYIDSAYPEFPNVGYDKQAGDVIIRRTSPNNYQIWGTTTATSNFNIQLNGNNVEVTVDPLTGEFYLTGWTGTLTNLSYCFDGLTHITSIKKFALDTSNVTSISSMFKNCTALKIVNLNNVDFSNISTSWTTDGPWFTGLYQSIETTDLYITNENTLNKLTGNLVGTGTASNYPNKQTCTIHYNDVDYKWQNNAWTPQSV